MPVVQGNPLQGSVPILQGAGNPQQQSISPLQGSAPAVQGPQLRVTPSPAPQPVYAPAHPASYAAPKPAQRPTAQSIQLNPIFDPYIGTRASSANPGVLEYYNKQTGQGFANPNDLFSYASNLGAGQVTGFDQLQAPVMQGAAQGVQSYTDPSQSVAQGAGNAGLSVDDLTKLAQANGAVTPDELNAIYQGLGITPDFVNSVFAKPSQSTIDLYNQAYNAAGLGDLHQQLLDLSDQIAKAKQNYTEAQGAVNENPFLDEATRVGRINRLNNQATAQINNLVSQQQNLNNLYTQGVSEANAFVTRNTDEFNIERTQAAAKLNTLIQMAQQQSSALANQNAQKVYRYLPDYLQNKTASNPPIGDASSGFYKYNPATKSYEQIAGPANKFAENSITGELYNTATGQAIGSDNYSSAFGAPPPQTGAAANLPQRNNNPGDLKGANGQFAVFSTPQQGWNALVADITAKQSGNTSTGLNGRSTLMQFAATWDPKGDGSNDPVAYAQKLASQLGVTTDTPIGQIDAQKLATAVAVNEGYFKGAQTSGSGNLIQQAAQQLVDGTLAPSQISARGLSKQVVLNAANQLSQQQKGVPFDAQQAETNYQNKQNVRPILNLEQSASSHLDTLANISAQFSRTGSAALNKGLINAQQNITGGQANSYMTAYNDALGEVAKFLSGGGTPTDEARSEAQSMLNPYLGHQDLLNQIATIKQLMKQKEAAYTDNSIGASQPDLSNIDFSM